MSDVFSSTIFQEIPRTYLELIEKIESEIEILNKEIMIRMQKLKEDFIEGWVIR